MADFDIDVHGPGFNLGDIQGSSGGGIDSLFEREAHKAEVHGTPGLEVLFDDAALKQASDASEAEGRRKVASLEDLKPFIRLSAETLIHRSEQDLWSINKEADGFYIQRLFDDSGEPLKG